jgi:methyl-accepting chemotaxis protein
MILTGGGSVLYFTIQLKEYYLLIDIAGRNRMLSQKMAKTTLLYFNGFSSNQHIKQAQEAYIWHYQSIKAFKQGGEIWGYADTFKIQPLGQDLKEKIQNIENELIQYSNFVYNPSKNKEDYQFLLEDKLLKANQSLVGELVKKANSQYQILLSILLLAVSACLIMVIVGYFFYNNLIIKPITKIAEGAEHIAQGSIKTYIDYQKNNELGRITLAINNITSYLQKSAEFIIEIGKGNFNYTLQVNNQFSQNTLGYALIEMRDKLLIINELERENNFINEGIASVSEKTREHHQSINSLCQKTLNHLAKYLQCQQGKIYVLNNPEDEANKMLNLIASYAINQQNLKQQNWQLGEGFVGQTFMNQNTCLIENVPPSYFKIQSGLGETIPKNLLLIPLKYNDTMTGIIELASLKPINKTQITTAEKAGEIIASSILRFQNNKLNA